MKQFHFSSNLSTLMELYLTTRNEEGYLSDHYGYYLQELDCLSKAIIDIIFLTVFVSINLWAILTKNYSNSFLAGIAGMCLVTAILYLRKGKNNQISV